MGFGFAKRRGLEGVKGVGSEGGGGGGAPSSLTTRPLVASFDLPQNLALVHPL